MSLNLAPKLQRQKSNFSLALIRPTMTPSPHQNVCHRQVHFHSLRLPSVRRWNQNATWHYDVCRIGELLPQATKAFVHLPNRPASQPHTHSQNHPWVTFVCYRAPSLRLYHTSFALYQDLCVVLHTIRYHEGIRCCVGPCRLGLGRRCEAIGVCCLRGMVDDYHNHSRGCDNDYHYLAGL
jgi:hypothetical protein